MSKAFVDHFQGVTQHYLNHRPSYPAALFDWLAQRCSQHELAWDCGTGNGQAAVSLAQHFQRVLATDASAAQIAAATAHERVEYRLAPAEKSGLEPASVDLLIVAQALHWFDLERFYAEARRVLKPTGIVAVWCYGIVELEGDAANQRRRRATAAATHKPANAKATPSGSGTAVVRRTLSTPTTSTGPLPASMLKLTLLRLASTAASDAVPWLKVAASSVAV